MIGLHQASRLAGRSSVQRPAGALCGSGGPVRPVAAMGAALLVWVSAWPPALAAEPAAPPKAVGSPHAQAALEVLLNSPVGRSGEGSGHGSGEDARAGERAGTPAAGAAPGRIAVKVARGQSLDAILRQHLAASPLRVEVLRELVRQLNPQAFAPGAGHRLLTGAQLQLPSPQDQLQHAFGQHTAGRAGTAANDPTPEGGAAAAARKGWVRYP